VIKNEFQLTIFSLSNKKRKLLEYYGNMWVWRDEDINIIFPQLVRLAVQLHYAAGSNDFFILHGVTGTFAAMIILDQLTSIADKAKLVRNLWLTLIATYIAQGRPPLEREIDDTIGEEYGIKDWNDLKEYLIKEGDEEHKPKVVLTCFEFEKRYFNNDRLFFITAVETVLKKL